MEQSWGALSGLFQIKLKAQCFPRAFSVLTDGIQSLVGPDLVFFEINPNEIFMVACQVISTNCLIAQFCFYWTPVLADVYMASGLLLWFFLADVVSNSLALKVLVECFLTIILPWGKTPNCTFSVLGGKEINSLPEPRLRFYCIHVRLFSAEVLLCLNWTSWNQLCLGSNHPQNQSIPQVLSRADTEDWDQISSLSGNTDRTVQRSFELILVFWILSWFSDCSFKLWLKLAFINISEVNVSVAPKKRKW